MVVEVGALVAAEVVEVVLEAEAAVEVQCRHFDSVLIVWTARALYTIGCPSATQFPGHRCMDDLTTERLIRNCRVSLIRLVYFLKCHPQVFVQPGTSRRPVD